MARVCSARLLESVDTFHRRQFGWRSSWDDGDGDRTLIELINFIQQKSQDAHPKTGLSTMRTLGYDK